LTRNHCLSKQLQQGSTRVVWPEFWGVLRSDLPCAMFKVLRCKVWFRKIFIMCFLVFGDEYETLTLKAVQHT
jgi:hypothetical protein